MKEYENDPGCIVPVISFGVAFFTQIAHAAMVFWLLPALPEDIQIKIIGLGTCSGLVAGFLVWYASRFLLAYKLISDVTPPAETRVRVIKGQNTRGQKLIYAWPDE